ncbi:MAG: acetylhydrolase [Candidatus Parabeggiatoa sp. nov. 2]|nr:MAG: hypothetical protein B6247_25205 [Beggiatoa sp. 4572_84]RKZ62664.1 MAG: acetylhydrolase [Gammaproteobacteria bacterium]HEC83948.1 acetylhydrolase [Thioploca sp.]
MTKYLVVLLALLMISLSVLFRDELFGLIDKIMMNPSRFEEQIRWFETNDIRNPPEKGAILFVGSSSLKMWKTLEPDMAPLKVINRGFGGSQATHVIQYVERIVIPYQPTKIVFYEGDNDIAAGKSPRRFLKDCQTFVEKVHTALPDTTIYFLSIKPSLAREHLWKTMQKANALLEEYTKAHDFIEFIDISNAMYDEMGKLLVNVFQPDGVHLNAAGYQIWTEIIKKRILQ